MEKDFNIFFVNSDEEDEHRASLLEAFELLQNPDHNFKPQWISQEECLLMEPAAKQNYKVFVFGTFEGAGFEHVKSLGYRIYGPQVILSNLQNGLILPKEKKRPIFNLAMKGVKICCTSIDKATRETMLKMVHMMAGEMTGDLTDDVTHLVAGEVGSNKYKVAINNNKVVMKKDWVEDVWQSSQNKHILATDEVFKKHKCPFLLGLTVVVSGFASNERNQIKNFVTKGGGKYSGELKMNECTHLIVKEAKGAKYDAAKNWRIKIIRDKWLYDCMDKGRYLDTEPYEFKRQKSTKTSTPERLSVAAPNLMDVSNISSVPECSLRVADESEMPADQFSFALNTVAETKLGVSGMDVDVTVQPADIFLDGCKIYLSGVQNSIQEKLKKIITAGGGFRAIELTEEVTHVVMDEIIAADVAAINKLSESPHVVSSNWLMDCFAQSSHLDVNAFLRTDVDDKPHDRKKIRAPPKFPKDIGNVTEEKNNAASVTSSDSKKNDSKEKIDADMESDLMMANILSQYTADGGDETVAKADDADLEVTKVDKGDETQNKMEMTQDPTEWDDESMSSKGMFYKKTFMFFGIEGNAEDVKDLEDKIQAYGGRIVPQGKKRQIADVGIVPLTGFIVDATVSEVLTVMWLQLCIENETLVPFNHWLARPIELPEEDILDGVCISVSGYIGIERESIMYLARSLGAKCEDHFARCANKAKNVEASTHLIVSASGGSKYVAAKKWKIPAVGKEWLEGCIRTKQRVSEDPYDIDVLESKLEEAKSDTSGNNQDETAISGRRELLASQGLNQIGTNKGVETAVGNKETDAGDIANAKDSTRAERSLSTTDKSIRLSSVQTPSPTTKENLEDPLTNKDSDTNETREDNPNPNVDGSKKAACQPNQSDNIKATYNTPTFSTPLARRKKKLALQGTVGSPASPSTPLGLIKGGGETPGTFLNPDFRPKFNVAQFMSPDTPQATRDLNTSTPLGEVFSRQIAKAAQNAANLDADEAPQCSQSQPTELPPLHGVIIAVAKKLGRSHATYNSLVVDLGGDYSWQYNDSVTHFVFQGRVNDTNKEFRTARNDGKFIVSPHWLTVCKEQGCRVDESIFPHHYNPLASSKETPSKSVRATRNRAISGDTPSRAASSKTPSRKMPVLDMQELITKKPQTSTSSSRTISTSSSKDTTETASNWDNEKSSPEKKSRTESEPPSSATPKEAVVQQAIPDDASTSLATSKSVNNETVTPVLEETSAAQGTKSLDSKSQEMKDALAKTLGSVLEEASRSKKTKKKKGRIPKLSGGQLSASGVKTPDNSSRTGTPTAWSAKEPEKHVNQFPEPSQSLQVTWDDPTERLEKEKLAHRLERVCDPSQNTDDFMAGLDLPSTIERPNASKSERSPTPEAPSIAFPVPQPATSVLSPQPVTLLSDNESCDGRLVANQVKEAPVFLFSGMKNEERVEYGALVEQLGGKLMDQQHFDTSCTHLVVSQPMRNEKYLSAIAAGKWVLHKSFLEACSRENKLVSEETHEWGTDFTMSIMQNMTSHAFKLAFAAHKWRKKIKAKRKENPDCRGAFDEWKVMLCLTTGKECNFKRMLEAGGASVFTMRPPFPDHLDATHAFLDKTVPQEDLVKLIKLDLHCLTAEYIAAYLTEDPQPEPSDFYHAEIVALKASMPESSTSKSRKRRVPSDDTNSGSRKSFRK